MTLAKGASSLGIEGNYTKDRLNYSRSLWFDYLPFYHLGVRANFKLTDAISANYWVVNGTQQSEPFNGYKDELFGLALQPAKSLSWTMNYYLGQEHPDTIYFPNGAPPNLPNLPTWQGVACLPIAHPPQGKMHIFDSYATWNATPKLTLALEGIVSSSAFRRIPILPTPTAARATCSIISLRACSSPRAASTYLIAAACSREPCRHSKKSQSPASIATMISSSCGSSGAAISRTSRTFTPARSDS